MHVVDRTSPGDAVNSKGQVLAVFALSLITLLGFAGLALDGGSTFAQKRGQQTAADMAALAAANDYLINGSSSLATTRAQSVTQGNGFTHASGGTTVSTSLDTSNGIAYTVTISSPHQNTMAGLMGMPTWMVTTTATALAGFPDSAHGASPFIFPISAFAGDGTPLYQTPTNFGETNGDIPSSQLDFAWTNYGTGNLDTTAVDDIIQGTLVIDKTIEFGEYIGQKNYGQPQLPLRRRRHLPLRTGRPRGDRRRERELHGLGDLPRHQRDGGSAKHVYGYFEASYESSLLSISACSANDCPRYLGSYILKLSN